MTVKPIKNAPTVVSIDQSTINALESDNHDLKQLVDLLDGKINLLDKKLDAVYGLVTAVTTLSQQLAKDAIASAKGAGHDGE
tara:strand:- start:105 stop:350 length:246 start_codon:yes stop_codon:yes gene_type:complete